MKKILLLFLLVTMLIMSGCSNKKDKSSDELKIDSITDYYISYYSSVLERNYKESYAAYLYANPNGNIESFKAQYEHPKDLYEFIDINGDGIDEFIIVIDESKSTDNFLRAKSISIYTIDKDTKKVSNYLSGDYWDNFYYNKNLNIYISKYNLDDTITNLPAGESTNFVVYSIMEFNDDLNSYVYLNKIQHNTLRNIYLYSHKNNDIFTRDEMLNGNIDIEEATKYLSDLNEIKLNLKDLSEIFNKTYEDSMLESIDKLMKGSSASSDSNLKCTIQDIDKIIKALETGQTVKINLDSDIKIDKSEGLQYYNKEYPYFSQYTISCGSYSRTIRISHK